MARLDYVQAHEHPELAGLIQKIRSERGGRLLNLYKMLLNSPPVAEGWLKLLTAIRRECRLPGQLRELVTLRVAVLNGAVYEHDVHVPFAIKEGVSQEQIDALPKWRDSNLFDGLQRAVLAYTESMTKEIHVADEIFEAVSRHLNERELVELTATIAAYNMVSRFLEALQLDPEQSR